MGRSMASPSEPSELAKASTWATVYDGQFKVYFQVSRQGSDLFQSEYQIDEEGKEVFRHTEKIDYVIGSGAQGTGYITQRGNYLFEAPLSYYTHAQSWALSPGYESFNYGFSRPILAECIACHSGRPQPVPNRYGLYHETPFFELAVGCENCHGPGDLHVRQRMSGAPIPADGTDRSIVNPAKLPNWLANNICMSCHQTGEARILKPGKSYTDFRPGTPLDETLAIFRVPLKPDALPQTDLLEHYFSMILSKCYRASNGRLTCVSCHDPHVEPSREEASANYRTRCLSCHEDTSCRLPLPSRLQQVPPNNCAGCHLPKREVKGIEHAAMTNHRIVLRSDEPYPDVAFHMTTPQAPDLIHLSAVPGRENDPVAPLVLLAVYRELVTEGHAEYQKSYSVVLDRLVKTDPDDLLVLSALAQRSLAANTPEGNAQAILYLAKAIREGSEAPEDYIKLAELYAQSNRTKEAIEILQRGISLAPYTREFYESLAVRYVSLNQYGNALKVIQKGLEIFPEDVLLRILLRKSKSVMLSP
jgi:predicted CXXCH cytochrome family protein